MIKYDAVNRRFDCDPTLTDTQVLELARKLGKSGYGDYLRGLLEDKTF